MSYRRKRYKGIIVLILTVVFIFGCGGKGFSILPVYSSRPTQMLVTDENLTWQDSLVQEMVDIINPDTAKAKEYYNLAKDCFANISPEDSRLQRLNSLLEMPFEENTFEGQPIEDVKREVIKTLLSLSQNERISIMLHLQKLIVAKMNLGSFADALSLSFFRKGLLLTTQQSVNKKVAAKRGLKRKHHELQSLRVQLTDAIALEDTIHIPQLGVKIANIERDLSAKIYLQSLEN